MKKMLWGLIAVVVLILAAQQLTASGKTEEPVPGGAYRFYYYPTSNFYYDVSKGNFVYSLDGGRSWEVQEAANPQTAKAFKDRKVIDSPTPEVWKYNGDHRRKWGGLLVDYSKEGSVAAESKEERRPQKVKKDKDKKWKGAHRKKEEKGRDKEREEDKDEGRLKDFTKNMKEKFRKLGKEE